MSRIGNDLLPNVYISEIQVHDGEFISKVYAVDNLDSPTWSKKELYRQHYKIMLVYTKSRSLINSLNGGTTLMDPKEIYKNDKLAVIETVTISQTQEMIEGTNKLFCFTFRNKIELIRNDVLFVFSCIVIDPEPILGTRSHYKNFLQGPISSEKIMERGLINNQTFNYW